MTTTFRGTVTGCAEMHNPVRSNCRRQQVANANDFVTFKWTGNQALLVRGRARGNCRLRLVGQLMNHLMENAIPDFRSVCSWHGLSLRFMSPLVFYLPFRSILNCCFILALGHGFLLATRNVGPVGVLGVDKPLCRNNFSTGIILNRHFISTCTRFSPFATHLYLSFLFSVFQQIKRSTMLTNKFALGGLALLTVSLLVISRTDAAPMPR